MAVTAGSLTARLAARRAQARRVLWVERIWPALWPAATLLAVGLAAALFDLPAMLPPVWHLLALLAFVAAIGALAWRGLRPLVRPTDAEVDRRLERATGLRHRPLVVIGDRPASPDPAGAALWQAHLDRAAAQVARLRAGWPHPAAPRREVRAARLALGAVLLAGVVVAGSDLPGRLLRSAWPGLPVGAARPGTQLQAWLTPPSYTGLPPVFLHPETPDANVPAGSHLTVNLTGAGSAPTMSLAGEATPFTPLDASSWQAERDVADGGALVVRRPPSVLGFLFPGELSHWTLTAIPDAPPTAAWTEAPGAGRAQRRLQTRLPWTVTDDYGVASLQAELRLKDRPDAPPLVIALPLPGGSPKQAHGIAMQDLTANPWAGLPVVARLVAKDAPGHAASSGDAEFILPERQFKNPLARAVLDVRKRLSLSPEANGSASADLEAMADAPEAFDNNTGVFLALSSTSSLLKRRGDPVAIEEAQSRLWSLALQLEDDAVARTAQAVQAAKDALQQSVQKGDKTDIDRKAEALRREIQRHLQALAERSRKDGTLMPFDPSQRALNEQDFNKLTQEMKDAAKAGRMEEAQDKMRQLEQMLEMLKSAEANPSSDRQQSRSQRRTGQQQMGAAEDIIQREEKLRDRANARQTADDAPGRDTDGKQGRAMRRALGVMMQNFGDLTGKVPDGLSQADIAMSQADQALAARNDKETAAADQRAIDALKKGEQQMSQQMAQSLGISLQPGEGEGQGDGPGDQMSQGDDGQGDQPGDGRGGRDAENGETGQPGDTADGQRDPLGRSTRDGTSGRADGGDVHVPDQMEQARTREIQTELRRREGERTRPASELDYIDRLLKAF